jgi:hypothetical protein
MAIKIILIRTKLPKRVSLVAPSLNSSVPKERKKIIPRNWVMNSNGRKLSDLTNSKIAPIIHADSLALSIC